MKSALMFSVAGALALALAAPVQAQDAETYQDAPQPIAQILDSAPTPLTSVSPNRQVIAEMGRANLPPIAELAEPDLRLAGYRINPRNNGPANSRLAWLNTLSFANIDGSAARTVALPAGARYTAPAWSPDGTRLAFLIGTDAELELWVADAATGTAQRLAGGINAAFGTGFDWMPDSRALVARRVVEGRGAAPAAANAPAGPIVQENAGRTAPVRTYQDLLANPQDEALFTHYFTAQPTLIPIDGTAPRAIGAPGLVLDQSVSPDGRYLMLTRVKAPFSYVVPARLFPTEIVVTDLQGRNVHQVADLPLRDDIPTQFDSVAPGPRAVQWRADAPATLVWVEAQDGGNARTEAAVRDRVLMLDAPFTGRPRTLVDLADRYGGIAWGRDDTALVVSRWFDARRETRFAVNPARPGQPRQLLQRNYQDRYNDPGMPVMRANAAGRPVMHFSGDGRGVFMSAAGATREGEYPTLSLMDLGSGETRQIWRAEAPYYESLVALLDDEGARLLTRRESRTDPPNLYLRAGGGADTPAAITAFADPAPQLADVTRRLVTYRRNDGVELSGTLYLPAGYDPARDGPLPLLMWAYPAEFTDASVAGQVVDTQNRFVRPGGSSHLFLLTQGYAILDNPTMPIVGADGAEPNDTYVEQLVASAEAAVNAVVEMGVASRDRIAVGGHSYGAFMTANLLAHSDLFRTGIARSGAYNRTLTPFGFQAEQRSYWDAVDTYTRMSPFTYVQQINEPILLIHGEVDDNSGTFPMQSERFYAALKGNGATARYVVMPMEAHGYRARESVGHVLWEMTRWLDTHLKGTGAPVTATVE